MRMPALAALAGILLLTGCVQARDVPPAATDADLESYLDGREDLAWQNLGLADRYDRPEGERVVLPRAEYFDASFACLEPVMPTTWGSSDGPEGPQLAPIEGVTYSAATKLAWFTCLTRYVIDPRPEGGFLTPAQQDYLYDYYQDWLVPCLADHGYAMFDVPEREAFVAAPGVSWNPYYASNDIRSEEDFEAAREACGPPGGGIDLF
jgi:hypothetical protein